ncbi:MAG TPA: DinB family protein [Longimicrobiales bacterium]|nr:DinB family protein [Longimicrobiales bacterium]
MNRTISAAVIMMVACTATANAQAAAEKGSAMRTTTIGVTSVYQIAKNYVLRTAEQVPQDKYSFKPTPAVRSLGAILGHIADAQHMFCAIAEGKPQPSEDMGTEKLTDKAAIIAELKKSFAHCDAVFAKLTDADLSREVMLFGNKSNVAAVVALNAAHDMEHYGNLITYMRINGIVPPSSQQ